jgi:hypothetical protein
MLDYAAIAQEALDQLREAGREIALQRIGKTLDPVTGGVSDSGTLQGTLDALTLSLNKSDASKLDVNLIQALTQGKLRKVLAAASSATFEPAPSDVLTFDGAFWIVRAVNILSPAGVALLYTLIVERGNLSDSDQAAIPVIALEEAAEDLAAAVIALEEAIT